MEKNRFNRMNGYGSQSSPHSPTILKVIQQIEGCADADAPGVWFGTKKKGLTVAVQDVDSEQGAIVLGGKEQ